MKRLLIAFAILATVSLPVLADDELSSVYIPSGLTGWIAAALEDLAELVLPAVEDPDPMVCPCCGTPAGCGPSPNIEDRRFPPRPSVPEVPCVPSICGGI